MFLGYGKSRLQIAVVLLLLTAFVGACATSPIGKANQAADIQKQLVESAYVEFGVLHAKGAITNETYLKGQEAWKKWYKGQEALAYSLAAWKRVENVENGRRVSEALSQVAKLGAVYLDFVKSVGVDVDGLRKKLGV